ncbi:MAG: OmpA family protein [Lachnospiraceae bacterium]|nr:OmpA family protein [Lachnospiraceae bacterium]
MRKNRRNRAAFAEESYWQSFSDMMAALLLIFILIIAITLAIYRQKTITLELTQTELDSASLALQEASAELELAKIDLENYKIEIDASKTELENSLIKLQDAYKEAAMTKEELEAAYLEIENARVELGVAYKEIDDAKAELSFTKTELQNIVGIRTDIIGELQSKFNNSNMKVDPQNGSITFSSDVLFEYGKATLTKESQATLKEIIPIYLDVLLQDTYKDYIAEIIIEGHTDTSGSYKMNMELSSERAASVAQFCLDEKNGLNEAQIAKLQNLLTVNGRAYSDPVYIENTSDINMDASRRVEIKFRLKEDEMIEKIAEILGQ